MPRNNVLLSHKEVLTNFLHSGIQSEWHQFGTMSVYLRKGFHYLLGQAMWCVDIANVTIEQEEDRGKGHFTRFLNTVEVAIDEVDYVKCYSTTVLGHRYAGIFVENVFFDRFADYLVRRGFEPIHQGEYHINGRAPCFFLPRRLAFSGASNIDWRVNVPS